MLNKYYDEIGEAIGKIHVYVNNKIEHIFEPELIGRFNTYKEAVEFCDAIGLHFDEWYFIEK